MEQLEAREVFDANSFAISLGGNTNDIPYAIAATLNGGLIVAGSTQGTDFGVTDDVFVTRLDGSGNVVWSKSFAAESNEVISSVRAAADGTFYLAGSSNGHGGLILHLDSDGTRMGSFTHDFGFAGGDHVAIWGDNEQTQSQNEFPDFLVGQITLGLTHFGFGVPQFPSTYHSFVNVNGELYGDGGTEMYVTGALPNVESGEHVVFGSRVVGGVAIQAYIAKGTRTPDRDHPDRYSFMTKGFNFNGGEFGVALTEVPSAINGGDHPAFGLLSRNDFFGDTPVVSIVRKVNEFTLAAEWEIGFGGYYPQDIVTTPDGGFLVAMTTGLTSFPDGNSSGSSVTLVKLSKDGAVQWQKVYGGGDSESEGPVKLLATGNGYVFTAATKSFGTNGNPSSSSDWWIVKTDLNGDVANISGLMRDIPISGQASTNVTVGVDIDMPLLELQYPYGGTDDSYTEPSPKLLLENPYQLSEVAQSITPKIQSDGSYSSGTATLSATQYDVTEGVLSTDIVVNRTGGSFGPATVYLNVALNGTADFNDYRLSYKGDQLGLGNNTIHFDDGETQQTITLTAVKENGRAIFSYDPNESFTVALVDPDLVNGVTINTATSTVNIINADIAPVPGVLQFEVATYTTLEDANQLLVNVTRTGGNDGTVGFDLSVLAGGTAGNLDTLNPSGTYSLADGENSQQIFISIFNDQLLEGDESFSLQLSNPTGGATLGTRTTTAITIKDVEAPTISVIGPAAIVPGQPAKFRFAASDPTNTTPGSIYTYVIDWADGTQDTLSNRPAVIDVEHAYKIGPFLTSYSVQISATVGRGFETSAAATNDLTVQRSLAVGTKFYVGGSAFDDTIEFKATATGGVTGTVNSQPLTIPANIKTFYVYGSDGNDQLLVKSLQTGSTKFVRPKAGFAMYGGDGNDLINANGGLAALILNGDAGNDILVGGIGADKLSGGADRDILIGGLGTDTLNGNQGDDVLIAGNTSFDGNSVQLQALMAAWSSTATYAARIRTLTTGAGPNLTNTTVFNDKVVDALIGDENNDWFLATTVPATQKDRVTGTAGEKLTLIN